MPDAVVAKAWTWIKTTRELKKVGSLAAACNAIAFLCRCRGYGLIWGDEVELELEATLKEALADVKAGMGRAAARARAPQQPVSPAGGGVRLDMSAYRS